MDCVTWCDITISKMETTSMQIRHKAFCDVWWTSVPTLTTFKGSYSRNQRASAPAWTTTHKHLYDMENINRSIYIMYSETQALECACTDVTKHMDWPL